MARTLRTYSESFRGTTTSGETVFRLHHFDVLMGDVGTRTDPGSLYPQITAYTPTPMMIDYHFPRVAGTWAWVNFGYWTAGSASFGFPTPHTGIVEENMFLHYCITCLVAGS